MKIDQITYFLETARFEHIGKAAKRLNISAGAISHSISALESEIGQPLFERKGRSIYLTQQGKALARKLEPILKSLEEAKREIQSDQVALEGRFKIAVTHGLSDKWITPSIVSFQERHQNLVFEIYSLCSADVVEGVSSGQFDLGICFAPLPRPRLQMQELRREQLVIAVRPEHPLLKAQGKALLARMREFPMISPKAYQGIEVCEDHPTLSEYGFTPKLIFDSYDVAAQAIRKSDGWGLIPLFFAKAYGLEIFNQKQFKSETSISAVYSKDRVPPSFLMDWLSAL